MNTIALYNSVLETLVEMYESGKGNGFENPPARAVSCLGVQPGRQTVI